MRRARKIVSWVLELGGVALVVAGCAMIAPELGLLVGGAALVAVGFVLYDG